MGSYKADLSLWAMHEGNFPTPKTTYQLQGNEVFLRYHIALNILKNKPEEFPDNCVINFFEADEYFESALTRYGYVEYLLIKAKHLHGKYPVAFIAADFSRFGSNKAFDYYANEKMKMLTNRWHTCFHLPVISLYRDNCGIPYNEQTLSNDLVCIPLQTMDEDNAESIVKVLNEKGVKHALFYGGRRLIKKIIRPKFDGIIDSIELPLPRCGKKPQAMKRIEKDGE